MSNPVLEAAHRVDAGPWGVGAFSACSRQLPVPTALSYLLMQPLAMPPARAFLFPSLWPVLL